MSEIDKKPDAGNDPFRPGGKNPFAPTNDPDNPYPTTSAMQRYMLQEIDNLLAALKGGNLDVSTQMSVIFGQIGTWCNNVVGQDSQSQTAMTGYTAGASQLQDILNSKGDTSKGTSDQVWDINQYTGKKEDGPDDKKVSTTQALIHEAEYLINNPSTQYKLNGSGQVMKDKSGNSIVNPAYTFFHSSKQNEALLAQVKSNIETTMTSLSQDQASWLGSDSWTVKTDGDSGYLDSSGKLVSGETVDVFSKGSTTPQKQGHYADLVGNMWALDAGMYDPGTAGAKPIASNPAILNAVNSATGSLANGYNQASSAVTAIAKINTQTLTSAQSNLNKFLQAIISMAKAMVSGQKTQ